MNLVEIDLIEMGMMFATWGEVSRLVKQQGERMGAGSLSNKVLNGGRVAGGPKDQTTVAFCVYSSGAPWGLCAAWLWYFSG